MRKADYIALANILNADIKHSRENIQWYLNKGLIKAESKPEIQECQRLIKYYELRESHITDLCRAIAQNISVDQQQFLTACGIK